MTMVLIQVLLAICLLLLVVLAAYTMQISKRQMMSEKASAEQIEALKHELSVVNSAAMGVGQRLIFIEKKLKLSIEKQQQLEVNNTDYQSYNLAASMAEEGAEVSQLVDRYGLPEAEASLLSLLNGARESADIDKFTPEDTAFSSASVR